MVVDSSPNTTTTPSTRGGGVRVALPAGALAAREDPYVIDDDDLMEEFRVLSLADPEVGDEARRAYMEMLAVPRDLLDDEVVTHREEGLVGRRAPLNPFRSTLMGPFRVKRERREKLLDPALDKNPLRGRLLVTTITSSALLFIFLQCLVLNKYENGKFHVSKKENGMIGPSSSILFSLGGLNSNMVRAGEMYRLFWSMWMHSGWIHITFNIVCQIQYLIMMEPDWGFFRSLLVFFVSGITGNLVSAVFDPCSTTVGSSGALFGLMGGMIPYCMEYWKSIPRPTLILAFSLAVSVGSILTGFTGSTDNWAHMGGMVGGMLFGLSSITTISALDEVNFRGMFPFKYCFPKRRPGGINDSLIDESGKGSPPSRIVGRDGKVRKKVVKRNVAARLFQRKVQQECKCGTREIVIRGVSLTLLALTWGFLFHFLLVGYEFQPTGHITYERVRSCCCCHSTTDLLPLRSNPLPVVPGNVVENWKCHYCDDRVSKSGAVTWGMKCENTRSLAQTSKALLAYVEDTVGNYEKTHDFDSHSTDRKKSSFKHEDLPQLDGSITTPLEGYYFGIVRNSSWPDTEMTTKLTNLFTVLNHSHGRIKKKSLKDLEKLERSYYFAYMGALHQAQQIHKDEEAYINWEKTYAEWLATNVHNTSSTNSSDLAL